MINLIKVKEVKTKSKKYIVVFEVENEDKEFTLSEELLVEYRLVNGKELDTKTYQKFLKDYAQDIIYQKVLHYALYKQRCTKEIVDYLKRIKVEESEYAYFLRKLYTSRILDDGSYARNFIEESFEYKKQGKKKIIFALNQKHIKPEIYMPFIENISEKAEIENVQYLINKKISSLKPQSERNAIQKLKQSLLNLGYNSSLVDSLISQNMNDLIQKSDEDTALSKDILTAKRKYRDLETKKTEKILAYLLRKGYAYHKIKSKLGDLNNE